MMALTRLKQVLGFLALVICAAACDQTSAAAQSDQTTRIGPSPSIQVIEETDNVRCYVLFYGGSASISPAMSCIQLRIQP